MGKRLRKCEIISPLNHNIPVLGVGGSVSTGEDGITADVLVVKSFDELSERASEAKDKIVVFNVPFINYGQAVRYRFIGASMAAKVGTKASLIRSVTPQNMGSLHTGMLFYIDTLPKIPHGAISIEDAELLSRLQSRGITPKIKLTLQSETFPDALSWNLRGELKGSELPEEIIALGGHIDSWDVGTGAHDDACGSVASWAAVKLIKDIGLKPRRTLRTVMWVNEENGARGGEAYKQKHQDSKHVLMFEFDSGCFEPTRIGFSGNDTIFKIVKFFEPLLRKINTIDVVKGGGGVDIGPMVRTGVPAMSLAYSTPTDYFKYHHSNSDTFDKIVYTDFNKCIAAIAVCVYLYADMPFDFLQYIDRVTDGKK